MLNFYYKDFIETFLNKSIKEIIGSISLSDQFDSTINQNKSWEQQIHILKKALDGYCGTIFFEFSIPRMGKRVDCLVIIDNIVFVIEFKVGENEFLRYHRDRLCRSMADQHNP